MRFGAKGLMSTLMRVRISSDAPRCTVQFGALDPRCTMVQVHGDPNEPSLGAGAAGAPCVTLPSTRGETRPSVSDGMQIGTEQDTAKWKPTAAWNEATEEARRPHAKTAQWPANAPSNAQERMQRQSMS